MKLYHIAKNSLLRRKTRMIFLILGLLIAISTVVTLITITRTMQEDIAVKLDEFGANILILPKSDNLSLSYGGMNVSGFSFNTNELNDTAIPKIRTIKNSENISIIAPKLLNVGKVQQQEVLVAGVNFDEEIRIKKWWSLIGNIPKQKGEAVIGAEVKNKLKLGLNRTVKINKKIFSIVGVLEETGSQDDGLIFIDLREAQELFNKPQMLSLIEVSALCYNCPIEEIVRQTSEILPAAKVVAVRQTIKNKMDTMHRFESFTIGISVIILLVGALIVFTTMSSSVSERKREIGIFRALGFRQKHVLNIVLLEGFFVSFITGFFGYFVGLLISGFTAPVLGVTTFSLSIDPVLLLGATLLSIIIGTGSSFYPAYKASRLDPSFALRTL